VITYIDVNKSVGKKNTTLRQQISVEEKTHYLEQQRSVEKITLLRITKHECREKKHHLGQQINPWGMDLPGKPFVKIEIKKGA
jgi:hypothetical protein